MKEKTFKFKIQETSHKWLELDLKTITERKRYRVFLRVPWYCGGWQEVSNPRNGGEDYSDLESAKQAIDDKVNTWINSQKYNDAEERLKDQLKTTVKIVYENEIKVDSEGNIC